MNAPRIAYLDYLKIVSVFAVVALHATGSNVAVVSNSSSWFLANFYNLLTRFAIPCFLMCSGAVQLGKSFSSLSDVKHFYLKYIPRYIGYIVLCLAVYKYFDIKSVLNTGQEVNYLRGLLYDLYSAPINLFWYLFLLLVCIIVSPILSLIVKEKWCTYLFLFIWFMAGIVSGTIKQLLNINQSVTINFYVYNLLIANFFVGYYFLGYVLNNQTIKFKTRTLLYATFGSILILNIITSYAAQKSGTPQEGMYLGGNIFIMAYSICVFLLFKNIFFNFRLNTFIKLLSSRTVYIYIFHLAIPYFYTGGGDASRRAFIVSPVVFIICFAISLPLHPILVVVGRFIWKILSVNALISFIEKKFIMSANHKIIKP